MIRIAVRFEGVDRPLNANRVTARGLHGVLYRVLNLADAWGATWLHEHSSPKPYSLVPYFDLETETLAGVQLTGITEDAAQLLAYAWQMMAETQTELVMGDVPFVVRNVEIVPGASFEMLAETEIYDHVHLEIQSPMSFQQGRGGLPLPLPRNVFSWPSRVWTAFAPDHLQNIPEDWLHWCERNVYVIEHNIQTVPVTISWKQQPHIGFVGDVVFQAKSESLLYKSLWQSLVGLLPYTGAGHKTTMGMGAVNVVQTW